MSKSTVDILEEDCLTLRRLDEAYFTSKDSPLHHDNRCRKCKILKESTKSTGQKSRNSVR